MRIKRDRKLTVALSVGESANLDKLAHLAGVNVSDYIRRLLLREWVESKKKECKQ